ncbi:MAG: HyaD/HybD family hydrogenase maturation endopeptidase [Thiobacillaceae bacterium]|nr:HyaD/HybD family hydrogenase maturation endopeptidase [Thiobacillaceae bacterium]
MRTVRPDGRSEVDGGGRPRALVLGIGNLLMRDDGVGVRVVQALQKKPWPGVEYLDAGTASFALNARLHGVGALVVIDAAQMRAPPGTVQVFEGEAMDRFIGARRPASVHELGLADLMAQARLTGDWPALRALVAIQPAVVDWGEALSAPLQTAVDAACDRVRALLAGWGHGA